MPHSIPRFHRPRLRRKWLPVLLSVGWTALSSGALFAQENENRAFAIERVEAGSLVEGASSSYWTVVAATSTVATSTPEAGLIDFARRGNSFIERVTVSANPIADVSPEAPLWDGAVFMGEEAKALPPFWTAPAPATYTLTFTRPFELRYVDLAPPSRKHGFADFSILVRGDKEGIPHEVEIKEATVAAGATRDAGFRWRLQIVPERAVEVELRFHLGSVHLSRQVFLQDLDLWGKAVEPDRENEGVIPGEPN